MASADEFYHSTTGKMIYQGDPDYTYKLMKHGEFEPDNLLQKADILLNHADRLMQLANRDVLGGTSLRKKALAHQNEAKNIYFDLLRHKESLQVHRLLAPLLTIQEARAMLNQYRKYPPIRHIYREQLRMVGVTSAEPFLRWLWRGILLALILLFLGFLFWFLAKRLNLQDMTNTRTNITEEYVNDITYIDQMQNVHFDGTMFAHSNVPSEIATQVDHANIPVGANYSIQGPAGLYGYATNEGDGHYSIHLLNGVADSPATTDIATPTQSSGHLPVITPYQLNVARTAYSYYLSVHQGVVPDTLAPVKSLVPEQIPLDQIQFTPSTNPDEALTVPNQSVPFQTPDIQINLSKHTLTLAYNHQTLLQTPTGVGSPKEPTPTGTFTVTDRIVNHASPVYGDYIFPLNNSPFAIHGTNVPSHIGNNQSLGCVEIPNTANDELFNMIPVGTPVIIEDKNTSGAKSPTVFR